MTRWLALAILATARISLGVQFQSLAAVALPVSREFGLAYADLGFLVGLYMLPGIVLAIPGGLLGQRFGDKRIVLVGLVLMTAGAVLTSLAASYPVLIAGRLMAGTGGVLLNVVMSKMIADWFAGREIILAMAIFICAYPTGVGLALLLLGRLAETLGWRLALDTTALAAFAALLLVLGLYRRHPNDGRSAASAGRAPINRHEVVLVCLVGAIWGIYNGAYAIVGSFTPILLVQRDLSIGMAGLLMGASTWIGVVSIPTGGMVAQRWGHASALLLASMTACGACLLAVPLADPALPLLLFGLVMGIPIGIITALPVEVLRPESRGAGLGLFYTGLYVGHAGLPPVAGWLQDVSGRADTSLYFAGALMLSLVPLFLVFRLLQRGGRRLQTATP